MNTTKPGVLQFSATADAAPSAPGAYILQVDIAENVLVTIAGRSPTELTAGRYLYCGSAKGPGGLRARLARHMRHGKSVHWHIDQLTEHGIIIGSCAELKNTRSCCAHLISISQRANCPNCETTHDRCWSFLPKKNVEP